MTTMTTEFNLNLATKYARKLARSPHDADDIVQEAWLLHNAGCKSPQIAVMFACRTFYRRRKNVSTLESDLPVRITACDRVDIVDCLDDEERCIVADLESRYTMREIAERIGVSLGTVHGRIERIREKLS